MVREVECQEQDVIGYFVFKVKDQRGVNICIQFVFIYFIVGGFFYFNIFYLGYRLQIYLEICVYGDFEFYLVIVRMRYYSGYSNLQEIGSQIVGILVYGGIWEYFMKFVKICIEI